MWAHAGRDGAHSCSRAGRWSRELVGDFSDWEPLAMDRTIGDTWSICHSLAAPTVSTFASMTVSGGPRPSWARRGMSLGGVVGLLLIPSLARPHRELRGHPDRGVEQWRTWIV